MSNRDLFVIDLPISDYSQILDLQQRIVSAKADGRLQEDVLIVVEHFKVFTLGNRGGTENLKVSESFLKKEKIQLVKTRRGGDITYHGPGQLVAYPIISLQRLGFSVPDYIHNLEEVMIQTAADFGVGAVRNAKNHGVWVGDRKLGSVGIAVRRGVAYHGLALNVITDLVPYSWINPCGLNGAEIISMESLTGTSLSLDLAREKLVVRFQSVFQMSVQPVSDINHLLTSNER